MIRSIWSWFVGVLMAVRLPNLLVIGCTQLLAAAMLQRHGQIPDVGLDIYLVILSTMMVAAGGYVINDYYDLKIDLMNRPDEVIVGRELSRRKAIISHTLISVTAVGIGFWVSNKIGLTHIFSVTLLWWYSNHLRRLIIGKTVIACLTAIAVLLVGFLYDVVSYPLMAFGAFGAAIIWIRELIKDMENAPGERAFGVVSVPEVLGVRATKWFILLIAGIGAALLTFFIFQVDRPLFSYYYLSISPFVVTFGWLLFRADRRVHYKRLRYFSNFLILAGVASMLIV